MNRVYIKGIGIYPFTSMQQIADYASGHHNILVAVNAEKILNATDETRQLINSSIAYCDGAGPYMMMKRMGYRDVIKIAGCELWLRLAELFYKEKTFYLVGGTQPVIEETVAKLKRQFPGIRIVGYRNGYLRNDAERQALIDDVVAQRPDVVYVAMGAPKQELLMGEMQKRHSAIYQGLGGSFDVYTGHVSRAPQWWIDHNLEWLYRLLNQPSRIRRQVKLIRFAWWIVTKNVK